MINSIPINQQHSAHDQPQQGMGGESCFLESKLEEGMEVENICGDKDNCSSSSDNQSHTRTVQALRKYLQRKLSSEDSSSERESQSPQETDSVHNNKSFEQDATSTLTCSIVYSDANSSGRNKFLLQKQRSLDDYSTHSFTSNQPHSSPVPIAPTIIPDHRYILTDLCVPILHSRCTFCDQSFELDDELREHMRNKHWNYFFDTSTIRLSNLGLSSQSQIEQDSACSEAMDLSMRKSPDVTGSLPNLTAMQSFPSSGSFEFGGDSASRGSKKLVKCVTCGKSFSTKWNWKQHQKIHLRENLQAHVQ